MRLLFFDRSKLQEHSEYGLDGLARLSVITMATFIWKIGCSFCVRLNSTISITSLSEFSRGGEAERWTILICKWYLFFVVICLSASIRHHAGKTFIFSHTNDFIIHNYDLFLLIKIPTFQSCNKFYLNETFF